MKGAVLFILFFAGVVAPRFACAQKDTVYSLQDQWRTRIDHNVSDVDVEALKEADVPIVYLENNEIPTTIKRELQSGDYYGWTVINAYSFRKERNTIYVVELDKGIHRLVLTFDMRGNVLQRKRGLE